MFLLFFDSFFFYIAPLNIMVFCYYILNIYIDASNILWSIVFSKRFYCRRRNIRSPGKNRLGESKHINIVRPCRNIIVSSAYALTSPARSQSISSMCVQDNAIPSGLPWLVLFGLRLTKISRDIRNGVAYTESQVTSWRNLRATMTFHASHAREHAHLGISGAN